ncbi:MAG TPA: tyrosine-type recombinase/integrase [Polyangia bacterium]|nr:tyrosine-type recombinase/integrase [Polyangia bacterium]
MEKDDKWIMRWRYAIAPKPAKPGVWRRREGGFLVRGRAVDHRTGKLREILKTVNGESASGAYRILQEELERVRGGDVGRQQARIRFGEYAASLFERKVTKGKIRSAKTREKWESVLRLHLLPVFGDHFLDGIRRTDIEAWIEQTGRSVRSGKYSPVTANNWLDIMRVIITSAVAEYDLPRNPIAGVEDIDTSTHFTYSEEQPNSLLVEEVPVFLAEIRRSFPQHFGMVCLGFATGLRPSSLRPLRRQGREADVLWEEGVVLVRRSHTRHAEVMEATKQKTRYRITLPDDLMAILRWHVGRLPPGPMRDSELLFPSETGGFRAGSALSTPFREVGKAIGLRKRITPRAMRRTFQDLARNADIEAIVRQKICGHATQEMSDLYSTIPQREIQAAVGAVISLAKYRELLRDTASWCESGVKDGKTETATRADALSGRFSVGVEGIEPSASTV